jgi:hypothetical protein
MEVKHQQLLSGILPKIKMAISIDHTAWPAESNKISKIQKSKQQ